MNIKGEFNKNGGGKLFGLNMISLTDSGYWEWYKYKILHNGQGYKSVLNTQGFPILARITLFFFIYMNFVIMGKSKMHEINEH